MPRVDRKESDSTKIVLPKDFACFKITKPFKEFHKNSFRFVPIPGPVNDKATVLVGCPLTRDWDPTAEEDIYLRHDSKKQNKHHIVGLCSGPRGKHGMKRHAVIKAIKGSRCGSGYTKMPMQTIKQTITKAKAAAKADKAAKKAAKKEKK
jgi:hypothetical protein